MILRKFDKDCLSNTARALRSGEVVIIPTDTVYGFSGTVPAALRSIQRIKGRVETKPFIQLVGDPDDIAVYSDTPIPAKIRSLMPCALTLIVRTKKNANIREETTAFRCPGDEWLRSLIRLCGKPLYSTSVNRSGCPLICEVKEMEKEFGEQVFCIVDGGLQKQALPSTIVDLSGGDIKIIRQGAVYID